MLEVKIFTLYPDLFPGPLDIGIFKKARENKIWNLKVINIREYSLIFITFKFQILFSLAFLNIPMSKGPGNKSGYKVKIFTSNISNYLLVKPFSLPSSALPF